MSVERQQWNKLLSAVNGELCNTAPKCMSSIFQYIVLRRLPRLGLQLGFSVKGLEFL